MRGTLHLAVALCVCALASVTTKADTIYSNFGGTADGGYLIQGPGFFPQIEQGFRFTAEVTGALDTVDLLAYGLEPSIADGNVLIYTESGLNRPGSLIESIVVPALPPSTQDPLPITTVSSLLNPILTQGTTYWITMKATSSQFAWALDDEMGTRALRFNGGAWATASSPEATVRLNSLPVVAPVPLPAAAWGGMVLMGVIAATKIRRRSQN